MKNNRTFVRIIAVMLLAVMLFAFVGCDDYVNNNPTVVKCGSVELGFQRFLNAFQNSSYYQYYAQGYIDADSYKEFIVNDLVSYGVQLDQAKKQGLTLTAEEEAEVIADADEQIKSYLDSNYADQIASTITDEEAKYQAELELLDKALKTNGSSYKEYRAQVEEDLRNSALIEKLRNSVIGDITVDNDEVKKYFEDNYSDTTTLDTFYNNFSNYITGSSTSIPTYMPIPKAAEPAEGEDGETAEAAEPNPYDELFSVLHLLVKFDTEPGDDVTDLPAYAAEDKNVSQNLTFVEDQLASLTSEEFINTLCFNGDVCEDPGMAKGCYQFFGYTMAESLISKYYEGFGNAAMMLKYPEWEPAEEEETADASATPDPNATEAPEEPEVDHGYERFTLADGVEVMRVFTNAGVHYIILNPNDWTAMYNEEGKLQAVMYEGDEPVKDGDSYVTFDGSKVSQEVFDAMQEAFSHVGDTGENEDFVASTCKTVYDLFNSGALTSKQNEAYTAKYNEWKEATNVTVDYNVIKKFLGI